MEDCLSRHILQSISLFTGRKGKRPQYLFVGISAYKLILQEFKNVSFIDDFGNIKPLYGLEVIPCKTMEGIFVSDEFVLDPMECWNRE